LQDGPAGGAPSTGLVNGGGDAPAKRGRSDDASDTSGVSGNYIHKPSSEISGGSANSYDRYLSVSLLHELLSKMDSQRVEMERQAMEIAQLKQKLVEENPNNDGSWARQAERSALEAQSARRHAEALLKQRSCAKSAAGSGPGGPVENYRRPVPGGVETIVISTAMIAKENKTNLMAMV
jgi:hypothetical protein